MVVDVNCVQRIKFSYALALNVQLAGYFCGGLREIIAWQNVMVCVCNKISFRCSFYLATLFGVLYFHCNNSYFLLIIHVVSLKKKLADNVQILCTFQLMFAVKLCLNFMHLTVVMFNPLEQSIAIQRRQFLFNIFLTF